MMKKNLTYLLSLCLFLTCATGEKAMKKGNNYEAVTKSLDRLQKKAGDEKAQEVLTFTYPLLVTESMQNLNSFINSRNPLKWEKIQGQ